MNFNKHFGLKDKHSFLSPSSYHWIRYDNSKLADRFRKSQAAKEGTILHAFAAEAIRLGQRLQANKKTLNAYVNDAIGYRMTSEQILFYSENCFGTADALGFGKNKEGDLVLRVFDLKTGESPASVDQLLVYAAIFCLEYGFKPFEILYDLRIYQTNEIAIYEVDPDEIAHIMDKIITFDKMITQWKEEENQA